MAEASLANIGPDSSLRHGVFARPGNLMVCDRCPLRGSCDRCEPGGRCALEREYVESRTRELLALPYMEPIDLPAVSVLVWMECRIGRAQAYLGTAGDLLPGYEQNFLELQPLAGKLTTLLNSYWRALEKLGVTPSERQRLANEGRGGPGAELAASIRAIVREEKETVQGDFEATDEEADGEP